MKLLAFALCVCVGLASTATPSTAATLVNASASTPISLGTFSIGQYQLTGGGIVDLVGDGSSFLINPDGIPAAPVTHPGYPYFNPDGSYSADGSYGPGGSGVKIGALMYSLDLVNWFTVGYSAIVDLVAESEIFAMVNDTYYSNNAGAYSVEVSAVPLPPALVLFGSALMGIGLLRRRSIPA